MTPPWEQAKKIHKDQQRMIKLTHEVERLQAENEQLAARLKKCEAALLILIEYINATIPKAE